MSGTIACSLWGRYEPVDRDREIEAFTNRGGYHKPNYSASSTYETWLHGDIPIAITIRIPNAPGKLPVVVYLPGLGEDTDHGELWKRAWVQSGYVVVSIQPKKYGEALWTNNRVKPGDYKSVGRKTFSQQALEDRLSQLKWTLEKLASRVHSGNERYGNIDLGLMALVGYDLGAQTAMALAGEKVDLNLPDPIPSFRSAIMISPHADPELDQVPGRYADVRMPLLLITSEDDFDPAKISTPESRKSIWAKVPQGEKYLLLFERANHRLLSGTMSNSSYWSEVIGSMPLTGSSGMHTCLSGWPH